MKLSGLLGIVILGASMVVGCGAPAPTAEDDAFQKSLAEAAAKNKGGVEVKHSIRKLDSAPKADAKAPATAASGSPTPPTAK